MHLVPISILLVEDSPTDALLAREALENSKVLNTLHHVTDGQKALAYLRRQEPYRQATRPALILLDLNLPRKSGLEVLEEIKSDPGLRSIPVVILTTSKSEEDVARSYGLHANCYVTKPVDFSKLVSVVLTIQDFWLGIVTLPSSP